MYINTYLPSSDTYDSLVVPQLPVRNVTTHCDTVCSTRKFTSRACYA